MKFGIIISALVVGAASERIKFISMCYLCCFSAFIYVRLVYWTWHGEGILLKMGMLDFAGGTVVISAGCTALAGAIVLKRRAMHRRREETKLATVALCLVKKRFLDDF